MHNHTEFCNAHYVKNADYIKFPFSASTVGPRVGAATLDMVGAALKVVNKGESAMNFNSGVNFFDPQVLVDHTKGLRCPLAADYWKPDYWKPSPPSPPSPPAPSEKEEKVPAWIIAVVVVACVLCLFVTAALGFVYRREKQGKPVFMNLVEAPTASTTKQAPPVSAV